MNLKSPDAASINILDASHRQPFERALTRILATDLAEETYAEILDGMPTAATFTAFHAGTYLNGHPAFEHHELCGDARERAREFRAAFEATSLQLPLTDAEFGSKEFNLRLLELLAVSCHQLAAYLYEINGPTPHDAEHALWRDEPREVKWYDAYRSKIVFSVGVYHVAEQYPHGLADVAGYWAEARIFGGVIVFDRGESETECRDIYIHAAHASGPRTIFPPTLAQFNRLMKFLLHDKEPKATADGQKVPPPLPIVASEENRWRWHPWDAFARYHIFRDRYERKISENKPRPPCQRIGADWPEFTDGAMLASADDEEEQAKLLKTIEMVTPSSPKWFNESDQNDMEEFYERRRSNEPADAWCYHN